MNLFKRLLKSKQEIDETTEEDKSQEVEKSFDEALDAVETSLNKADDMDYNEDEDEDKGKNKKKKKRMPYYKTKKSEDDDDDDDDEDGDDDDNEADIETEKSESDEIFVDAEPIIKSLMSGIRKEISTLKSQIGEMNEIVKSHAELSISLGKLLKSAKVDGAQVQDRKSVITKSEEEGSKRENIKTEERFTKSDDEEISMTKAEALGKLEELAKSGSITSQQVAVIEGRINKGQKLPDIMFSKSK